MESCCTYVMYMFFPEGSFTLQLLDILPQTRAHSNGGGGGGGGGGALVA